MTVEQAVEDIKQGKMVIVTDNESRENEGDLVMAADKVTPEAINFMVRFGRGLVCMPLDEEFFERLHIPMMTKQNRSKLQTAFGVSIGAATGITTGISAADRACTIQAAVNPDATAEDIVMPGHVFPLKAKRGGVLARAGHTEASTDLAELAGLQRAAVVCEIMNEDGTMARRDDLLAFAKQHQLTVISIDELITYRMLHESVVAEVSCAALPVHQHGQFEVRTFRCSVTGNEHAALIKGELQVDKPVLVRLHSECLTGDVFGSARCDCGRQFDVALERIGQEGGVLLYLRQEGRGIGLANKIKAYALQDQGLDTVEANHQLGFAADERDYGVAAQILRALGIKDVTLLTNNPKKVSGLMRYGINVADRMSLEVMPTTDNIRYLQTKREKLGHLLNLK